MTAEDRAKLQVQIMRHEGVRLKVYRDSLGIETIGVGRNLRDKGITHDEALFLLDNDLDECIRDCATFPWFADLDPVRQRAIVDLRFNLGARGLRTFKRMLAAMAERDYPCAAGQLRQSKWYQQVASRGPRIVAMLATGLDPL